MKRGRPEGFKMATSSRKKIAKAKTGRRLSAETRLKIGRSVSNTLGGGTSIGKLKGGMRIIAPEKFNLIDGKWDYRDLKELGHQLFGICTMDTYPGYGKGELDTPDFPVPEYVCDRRNPKRPEVWNLRHKQQFNMAKRLWSYRDNPEKSVQLHDFLIDTSNLFLKQIGDYFGSKFTRVNRNKTFLIHSFITLRHGLRFHWKITANNIKNGESFRAPVLAKIDGYDAVNFAGSFLDLINLVGGMVETECQMGPKVINTNLVCNVV